MKTIAKTFRQLDKHETIEYGDLHSMDNGKVLMTIKDPKGTIGKKPTDFSKERTWWRLLN